MLGHIRQSFHLFLIQASSFLQQRSILYIALLVGGTASVAIIDTSLKFAMLSTLATWAVGSMMAPKFVKLFKDKDIASAQFYFVAGSFAALLPALGIAFGFVLLGKLILHHLFGEQYVAAYIPTIIILASTAINAAGSLSSVVLMHNGFQKLVLRQTTWAITLGAIVAVGAGYLLGEIGIALGTLVSAVIRDIGLSMMLFQHTGLRPGALSPSGWKMAIHYGSKTTKKLTGRSGTSS